MDLEASGGNVEGRRLMNWSFRIAEGVVQWQEKMTEETETGVVSETGKRFYAQVQA